MSTIIILSHFKEALNNKWVRDFKVSSLPGKRIIFGDLDLQWFLDIG